MKFPYVVGRARIPQPSLGGGFLRPRPIVAVRVFGPSTSWLIDGHLDTAADDTVFPTWFAAVIGLDLSQGVEHDITLVGRGPPVRCRFFQVKLRISDGLRETYEWPAIVGFAAVPLRRALLGYAGFLQFFDADFHGADHEVTLTPNRSFPGRRI